MEASKSTARLLHSPENPFGERDIEVSTTDENLELRPIIEIDGTLHELRLVSFADGEGMPAYTYERAIHDTSTPQGFGCP